MHYELIRQKRFIQFQNGLWLFDAIHNLPFIPQIGSKFSYSGTIMWGKVIEVIHNQSQLRRDPPDLGPYGQTIVQVDSDFEGWKDIAFDESFVVGHSPEMKDVVFVTSEETGRSYSPLVGFK